MASDPTSRNEAKAHGALAKSEAIRAVPQRDTAQTWLDLALAQQVQQMTLSAMRNEQTLEEGDYPTS